MSFSRCCLNPHRCFQLVVWGFISQHWNSGLRSLSPGPPAAALLASCSFAHPAPQSATSLGLPAAALPRILSSQLPVSTPPTGLDECFFFISWVVRPRSSIFCQFWLFFVFKLLLSFFWLFEEVQCVYLCLHLGRKSIKGLFLKRHCLSEKWLILHWLLIESLARYRNLP